MVQYEGFDKNIEAKVVWQCVVYTVIWLERNAHIYKEVSEPLHLLWDRIIFMASIWCQPMASCISPLFFLINLLFLLQKERVSIFNSYHI